MDTADSNEGAGSLLPKRLRLEWTIIHCSDDNTDKLASLQNIDSGQPKSRNIYQFWNWQKIFRMDRYQQSGITESAAVSSP